MYQFSQFDPRNIPAAASANQAILDGAQTLGVEVTIPALAASCSLGNLDHHGPDSTSETPSACEQALTCELPPNGSTLATIRCDADSVTAMAVLASRAAGRRIDEALVRQVGAMDRLGPRSGKRNDEVVALSLKSADFKTPLAERVAFAQSILDGSADSAAIQALVAQRDKDFAAARAASDVGLEANGAVAVVVSTHRFATNLGYELANIIVAMNPEFPVDPRDPSKGTCVKYTVARYDSHVPCDIKAVLEELKTLEAGWGGQGDIIGSPQGTSSSLALKQVVEVVSRHLK